MQRPDLSSWIQHLFDSPPELGKTPTSLGPDPKSMDIRNAFAIRHNQPSTPILVRECYPSS